MVLALAALLPLITSHCELTSVPGLQFFACASDSQASADNSGPCEGDGCCSVEDGSFQAPRQQEIIPGCIVELLVFGPLPAVEPSLPLETGFRLVTAAPPDLPTSWQFSFRTALPPRAPSLAS
jgi:hypothetical protein